MRFLTNKTLARILATLVLAAAPVATAQVQLTWLVREPSPAQIEVGKELIGKVLNYEYVGWSDLRVLVHEDGIFREWAGGAPKDVRGRSQSLGMRSIAGEIYFLTWVAGTGGEDSVGWNRKDRTVFAHICDAQRSRCSRPMVRDPGLRKCNRLRRP